MEKSVVILIAHQYYSIYSASVCLGIVTPSPLTFLLYMVVSFQRRTLSKPENLVSQGPLLHLFFMADFRSSELQMKASL